MKMFKTFAKLYIFCDRNCYSYWHIKKFRFEEMRKKLNRTSQQVAKPRRLFSPAIDVIQF